MIVVVLSGGPPYPVPTTNHVREYSELSDLGLRQLLKSLEKEGVEVEWKLKDCGWRLDQTSIVSDNGGEGTGGGEGRGGNYSRSPD